MTPANLPNQLLGNRKRLSLSQDEVAFLLGQQGKTNVSRYEKFTREPKLETILAYEVLFQRPTSELFAGVYQKVEAEVAARAKTLAERSGKASARKRHIFTSLANKRLITTP